MRVDTDTLIANLDGRGVSFLNYTAPSPLLHLTDAELISGLAADEDARVRLALIPLFLRHPQISACIPDLMQSLTPFAELHLKAFYSAAVELQSLHEAQLQKLLGAQPRLISWFEDDLPIQGTTAMQRLNSIARYHARTSGLVLNSVGTYQHGAERFLKIRSFLSQIQTL